MVVKDQALREHVFPGFDLSAAGAADGVVDCPGSVPECVLTIPAMSEKDLVDSAGHGA